MGRAVVGGVDLRLLLHGHQHGSALTRRASRGADAPEAVRALLGSGLVRRCEELARRGIRHPDSGTDCLPRKPEAAFATGPRSSGRGDGHPVGASDEYHQTFVPIRGGPVSDVLIDSLGVGVVTLVFLRRLSLRRLAMTAEDGSRESAEAAQLSRSRSAAARPAHGFGADSRSTIAAIQDFASPFGGSTASFSVPFEVPSAPRSFLIAASASSSRSSARLTRNFSSSLLR